MPIGRRQIVLAAMAAGGDHASFLPVQMQKLLFLIDREASHLVEGPHFDFQPYDYGPFDRAVYDCLDDLGSAGAIEVTNNSRYRTYSLSASGYVQGQQILQSLPAPTRDYLEQIANWVRSLSFQQLVMAIYNRYPDMKVNSVFR